MQAVGLESKSRIGPDFWRHGSGKNIHKISHHLCGSSTSNGMVAVHERL